MNYVSRNVYEFISKQAGDSIIERKICAVSGIEFPIYKSDLDFYDKISPTFVGQKFRIPMPMLCPEERQRRRLSFRNERRLYKRKCDYSGKDIISIYSPDKPYKVYDQKIWRSDARDPISYGFKFDFSATFRENFEELMLSVPLMNVMVIDNENSTYTNSTGRSKNIYMSSDVMNSDTVLYSNIIKNCNYCCDISDCKDCKDSFQLVRSTTSSNCYHCQNINECINSSYLIDCTGCQNCYFSIGLNHKNNFILNKKAEQEDIDKIKLDIKNGDINQYVEKWIELMCKEPKIGTLNQGSERCYGNLLLKSNSSIFYYDSYNIDQCKYGVVADNNSHCFDVSICNPNCSFSYELVGGGEQVNCLLNSAVSNGTYIYYSFLCLNSSNLFGCIGLRNKQYCIFNKQYTKEEYEIQVAKIITHMQSTGEWGEFFHPSLSPFGYNETVAQEYFLIKKGELSEFGYKRSNYSSDPKIPDTAQVLRPAEMDDESWSKLVDSDNIIRQVIICEVSGRPYMIQKAELEFYRKHDLLIPRKHPDVRHEERMRLRPGRTLYLRTCDCCEKEMLSVYTQEDAKVEKEENAFGTPSASLVYCEQCYQKEVFG